MFRRIAGALATMAMTSCALLWSVSTPAAAQSAVSKAPTPADRMPVARTAGTSATRAYEDGLAVDAASYASVRGIGLEQARAALTTQKSVSAVLVRLADAYPGSFAGGSILHGQRLHGVARFVGTVPDGAAELVGKDPVALQGGASVSVMELSRRKNLVHNDLLAQGRSQVTTSYDVTSGMVEVTLKLRPEEERLPRATLLQELPQSVRNPGVAVEFASGDISVDEHTRGGALTPAAAGNCTTGFGVALNGVTGFLTAGHCDNTRDYQEPEVGGLRYDAPWQATHRGQWGDFQWHTTPHNEYAEFYASNTGIRPVQGYDGSIVVGEFVCKYGRTTGYGCSYIYRVNVSASIDGYNYDRLIAVEDYITDGGDSGGPWFLAYDAVGIHKGYITLSSKKRSYFSAIFHADEALGLSLLVQ